MHRNQELTVAQDELRKFNEHLEELVVERTAELSAEIAVRRNAEERVLKLNRIYALLSKINQAIVRIHDINRLFEEVCTIAVEEGKFQSVWIGLINTETYEIETYASSGLTIDLINSDDKQNPVFSVMDSGKTLYIQ